MNEQAMTETKDESMTSSTETGASDNLDALLSEFESTADSQNGKAEGEQTDWAKRVEALENEIQNERYQKEITDVASQIRGDSDHPLLDDSFVISYLEGQARNDPRIASAWAKRHDNPDAFNKVINKLGDQLREKVGKSPNEKLTENREALESAVRASSTSTQQSSEVDWGRLSDADFYKEKMKLMGR